MTINDNLLDNLKPNQEKAVFFAKKQLPELVYDAVNLEGITIGGHKLSDQIITLNQSDAWKYLFNAIENNKFNLDKKFTCSLHNIAAKEESLTWGKFRDGQVTIAGTKYLPPEATQLDKSWDLMLTDANKIKRHYDKAIYIFLQMARNQFFYDVNKRLGRFMMNGYLLSQGLPVINLQVKHKLEFNRLMLDFYETNNTKDMTKFMKSCLDLVILKNFCDFS